MSDAGNLIEPQDAPSEGVEQSDGVSEGSTADGSVGDPQPKKFPGWTEHLPGDLKNPETLERFSKFEKLGDFAKAYMESEGRLERAIEVPTEGATQEQVQAFREKLGIPKTPAEYNLKEVEVPEIVREPGAEEWFSEVAHKANLTKGQTKLVYQAMFESAKSALDKHEGQRKEKLESATNELRKEMGEKFDETVARCRKIVKEVGGQEFASYLDESGLSNDPRMVKFLSSIQRHLSNDQMPTIGVPGTKAPASNNPLDPANWTFTFEG